MRFHLCNVQPQGYLWGHFLDDFCRLMCYSLESLGHSCTMACNQIEPDRVNIIFNGHTIGSIENVDVIAGACKYIAIQHEILNPDGVNLSRNKQQFDEVYLPFMRRAIAVWEGIPRNLAPLKNLGIKTAFFRGGYHPGLEEIRPKLERDVDFLFYGSITPYRRELLERLSARGHMVVAVFDSRSTYRNDMIARAKVNVAPIQGPGMEHFAYGRVCYLLNNHSLVVVQRCEDQSWLESCFVPATELDWVDVCEQTLFRSDRDTLREHHCEQFRSIPFTTQVQGLLDATFSRDSSIEHALPITGGLVGGQTNQAIAQTG
jgi:hypothetical protein